ncbi:MAG TPA: GAF domain-containing protein, partial [Bradyrhizobium sp.]|nr:GAF domain-containing protein [Bradyrhizobium sp.]
IKLAGIRGISREGVELFGANFPMPLDRQTVTARTIKSGTIVHIGDVLDDQTYDNKGLAAQTGYRNCLGVPMHSKGKVVGAIFVARTEPGAFPDSQVHLLQIFADQAVIAMENVRLFNETKEALQRQTATADILKVIASSPSDVQPVFQAIAEESNHLLNGLSTAVFSLIDDVLHLMAHTRVNPAADASLEALFPRPLSALVFGEAIRNGDVCFISDCEVDYAAHPAILESVRLRGWRSALYVPLSRDGKTIGMISVTRREPGSFAERHVQLLRTFADQAVIAIENTRLFNETQEALERQTATADILKVIASSPDDVQPVFEAIAERANKLAGGYATVVLRIVGDAIELAAFTPISEEADAALKAPFPVPIAGNPELEAIRRGEMSEIVDTESEAYVHDPIRGIARARGFRSRLAVPLKSDSGVIGAISVTRVTPGKFAEHHIQLLKTFADQAVIAISNVELFQEVQQRTRDLSQSLDDLRTAQDRLVQTEKLASLGQLTAGIAHEIKNPLNFVNNFSALSAELTDELNDLLKRAALTDEMQEEVGELTKLLQENLQKVVQHGKRADSIVKNMLLHSREGSGEQRSADINALVDESLNLAYHGARAEKAGFNITLQRDFDASAGVAELFPQEITRALLNLISNGFYAANRRKVENGGAGFEPTLLATTKNLGGSVEIRIRDNGTGILPEVKEKMFNPFFTTKPAGEGTGLGLSMTHDIVVKQHGGRIDVETEPGKFTEFVIVLPRAGNLQKAK